jgi:hypothetical protein
LDIARGEAIEKELEAFIAKRSRQEPDRHERAEAWKASVRAYNLAREAERRALWADYHRVHAERLRRTVEPLIAHHEAKARALLSENEGRESA